LRRYFFKNKLFGHFVFEKNSAEKKVLAGKTGIKEIFP
jgi:hypothetical protein